MVQFLPIGDTHVVYIDRAPGDDGRGPDGTGEGGTKGGGMPDDGTDPPPVIFLHGATQSIGVWARQVARIRHRRRCIAYDARGHGRTRLGPAIASGEATLSLDLLAADCLALMDALGIERAVLCGVSMGGMTALHVAARAPERVSALVLANTPMALSLNRHLLRLIDWLNPYAVLPTLLRWVDPARLARIGLRLAGLVFGPGWAQHGTSRRFEQSFATMDPLAITETYRAICEARLPELGRVRCPVLVVTGEGEAGMIFRHAAEIARRVGTAELATIPGGHVTNLDSPHAFNGALARFFQRWHV